MSYLKKLKTAQLAAFGVAVSFYLLVPEDLKNTNFGGKDSMTMVEKMAMGITDYLLLPRKK